MANLNLNVQIFPFFDSVKTPLTESKTSDSFGNNGYDNLTLEVSGEGSATITVEGCVNAINDKATPLTDDECSWTTLATLSAGDYSRSATIGTNGIFFVGISGISRIRIAATGVSGEKTIVGAFSK